MSVVSLSSFLVSNSSGRIRFPKTVFPPGLYQALPEVSGYMPPFFVDFFLPFFFVGTYFFTQSKSFNLT
jgi:hypothetical protein